MWKNRKKEILIFSFLILFVGFLFRQYIFFGNASYPGNLQSTFYMPWGAYRVNNPLPSKAIGFDVIRMFYPVRATVMDQLKHMSMPLWNPYSFCGNTLLGTFQAAIFHPLSFIFFLLPQIDAWAIVTMLIPILTFFFMYLMLRSFGISKFSSVFGSVSYAFSGIMICWWQEMFMAAYSMLFLPLVIFAIHLWIQTKQFRWYILWIIGLLFSVLSGWFQATLYVWAFSLIFAVFSCIQKKESLSSYLWMLSAYIFAFSISAIQLIPSFEAYLLSARPSIDTRAMLAEFFIPVTQIIKLFIPDFYGNPAYYNYIGGTFYHERAMWVIIPSMFFFVYALTNWKRITILARFFTLSSVITLSLAFSLPTSWLLLYNLHIPFLSEMTPSRILFLSSFCIAVSSAWSVDLYRNAKAPKILLTIIILIVVFALGIYIALPALTGYEMRQTALRNSIVSIFLFITSGALFVIGYKWKKLRQYALYGLLFLGLSYIAFFTNKYLYFSKRDTVYSTPPVITELQKRIGIDRFWSVGEGTILRNIPLYFKLYSPEGYESFNIKRYNELIAASHKGGDITAVNRADVELYYSKDFDELAENQFRKKAFELTGVKYIVGLHAKDETTQNLQSQGFTRIWTDEIYDIFEYPMQLPRYFLTSSYTVLTGTQETFNFLYKREGSPDKTITLEKEISLENSLENIEGEVTLVSYTPNSITFLTKTGKPSLLYLSDTWYPGWNGYIDNTKTEVLRANYAFRAVIVPEGKHTIELKFQPKSFHIGIFVTLGGLSGLVILCFLQRKK